MGVSCGQSGAARMIRAERTLRTADDLVTAGLIPPDARADAAAVAERYVIAITPAMAALIEPSDPTDPIARQFVPDAAELMHPVMQRHESRAARSGRPTFSRAALYRVPRGGQSVRGAKWQSG